MNAIVGHYFFALLNYSYASVFFFKLPSINFIVFKYRKQLKTEWSEKERHIYRFWEVYIWTTIRTWMSKIEPEKKPLKHFHMLKAWKLNILKYSTNLWIAITPYENSFYICNVKHFIIRINSNNNHFPVHFRCNFTVLSFVYFLFRSKTDRSKHNLHSTSYTDHSMSMCVCI